MTRATVENLIRLTLLAYPLLISDPTPAEANVGMENIASGAKSAGMGGTSIAVGEDTTVMNTNPAAISRIDGKR